MDVDFDSGTFLGRIGDRDREELLAHTVRRRFPASCRLFFEGEPGKDVYLLLRGEVKVGVATLEGRDVVVNVLGPGELLGEVSAIDGDTRSATATALTDCEVATIPVDRFNAFLLERPAVMHELLTAVTLKLRGTTRRQVEFGTSDALGRVCARLGELVDRYGVVEADGVHLDSPMSQAELGEWAGLSREAVVKALRALRRLGWVENRGRTLLVHDVGALRERAAW